MRKYLICTVVAVASSAAVMPVAAWAQETTNWSNSWYGDLGYSLTTRNGADLGSVNARVGTKFTRYLGAEGELNVGVNRDAAPALGPGVSERLNTAVAAYGVGYLPLGDKFSLLARVGVGENQFAVNGAGLESHRDLVSVNYGAGATYSLSPTNAVRADYTRKSYDHDGGDDNTWALSFQHKF